MQRPRLTALSTSRISWPVLGLGRVGVAAFDGGLEAVEQRLIADV